MSDKPTPSPESDADKDNDMLAGESLASETDTSDGADLDAAHDNTADDTVADEASTTEVDQSSDDVGHPDQTTSLPESNQSEPERPEPKNKVAMVALGVSIVALLGVGAGGWLAGQQVNGAVASQSSIAAQVAALQAKVDAIGNPNEPLSALAADVARIDARQTQVFEAASNMTETGEQVSAQLQALVGDVAQAQTRLDIIEDNRATEYLLAEVEYLLRIAIQRVQAGRDLDTGLALLKSADTTLASSDDAAFFPIRKALASEIAALRSVPSVDRTGIYLELAAAAEQVDNLRMSPSEIAGAPVPEASDDAIEGAMKTLASFVTIRRRENAVEPLLAPAEAAYVRQNLRLMLEQSQLALLEGDSETWKASLERAQIWANRYFMADDAPTQGLIATLGPLASTEIAPELPAIGESLNQLRRVQAARVDALTGDN